MGRCHCVNVGKLFADIAFNMAFSFLNDFLFHYSIMAISAETCMSFTRPGVKVVMRDSILVQGLSLLTSCCLIAHNRLLEYSRKLNLFLCNAASPSLIPYESLHSCLRSIRGEILYRNHSINTEEPQRSTTARPAYLNKDFHSQAAQRPNSIS